MVKSFESGYFGRQIITQGILRTVRLLGEFKGREALFREQSPQALETLRQVAVIQSTESSNRIEGIVAPLARIQELVSQKTTPQNRSEAEIAGYRDVLNTIHANHASIPFTTATVLQLHRDLYGYADMPGGRWKAVDNQIIEQRSDGTRIVRFQPVSAVATPECMERLHDEFNRLWNTAEAEPLLLIAAYALDFLCIHPFLDGNGRMARLLVLLLLSRAGFEVGRFISLERVIEQSRESYYESLYASSQGWHDGRHSLQPWNEYLLGVLVAAYREFENRVGILTVSRGTKTAMVLEAVRHLPDTFRMTDVERVCPTVGRDMIRKVLRKLRKDGAVKVEGKGLAAVWRKSGTIP